MSICVAVPNANLSVYIYRCHSQAFNVLTSMQVDFDTLLS